MKTILEALNYWADQTPDKTAFVFLEDGERFGASETFLILRRRALALAATLQTSEKKGETVILLYPPGLDFVAAFFGCLYAGLIPVPLNPPTRAKHLDRIDAVIADAKALSICSTKSLLDSVQTLANGPKAWPNHRWILTDEISIEDDKQWKPYRPSPEDVAFLQYTSGSTGTPRGVMVTHQNIVHNQWMFQRAFETSPKSLFCGWVPVFHDLGLMTNVVHPVYAGATSVFFSPYDFIVKPVRWLKAMSSFKATHTAAPNFAYDLCIHRVEEEERLGLDLSHLRCAINGAEPVREQTMERFIKTYVRYGLDPKVLAPSYGMAEATLVIATARHEEGVHYHHFDREELKQGKLSRVYPVADLTRVTLPAYRKKICDQKLLVVHPELCEPCGEGEIGEIWVCGDHIAKGYWQKPLHETFRGRLRNKGDSRCYLRTGDIGVILGDHLYVAGRLKDMMIIQGRNIYPEDLEHDIRQVDSRLTQGLQVAFSLEAHDEECVALVQEVAHPLNSAWETLTQLGSTLSTHVRGLFDIALHTVVFIPQRALPRTSSGKVRRQYTKSLYLNGELPVLHTWHGCMTCNSIS